MRLRRIRLKRKVVSGDIYISKGSRASTKPTNVRSKPSSIKTSSIARLNIVVVSGVIWLMTGASPKNRNYINKKSKSLLGVIWNKTVARLSSRTKVICKSDRPLV